MATNNSKATVYLQPSNYEGLVQYAIARNISLKADKHGNPIVGSSVINKALAEFLSTVLNTVPSTVLNTVPSTVPVLDTSGTKAGTIVPRGDLVPDTVPQSTVANGNGAVEPDKRLEVLDDVQRRLEKLEGDAADRNSQPVATGEQKRDQLISEIDEPEKKIQELEHQVSELQQQAQALERSQNTRVDIAPLMWEFEEVLLKEFRLGKQAKKAKDIHKLIKRFIDRQISRPLE